jgi:hypothetical protein
VTDGLIGEPDPGAPSPGPLTVSVGALAWTGAALLFLGVRLGVTWQAPVGGAELVHLSGAWQAAVGIDDPRFVPTLFQALAAALFKFTTSEVPARVLAYAVTGTVPVAVYLLRRPLGEAGALLALVLLALDGVGIWQGVAASAAALDIALSLWLLVLMDRKRREPWLCGIAGFLVASAGPLPLVLAAAALGVALARGRSLPRVPAVAAAGGGLIAIAAASLGFGFGAEGLTVPPFDVFAASFEQRWSTATAFDATLLYAWPALVLGVAGAAVVVQRRAGGISTTQLTLLAWLGLGLAWLFVAPGLHSTLAVTAATTPAALLAGPFLSRAASAALHADWGYARFVLPAAGVAMLVAFAVMARWAREGTVRDDGEIFIVALLVAAVAGGMVALAVQPASRALLPAILGGGAVVALIAAASGVAFSGMSEPIPSPLHSPQAPVLRAIALQLSQERGGPIVVHPDYRDDVTWAFRDSGTIVIASRVPSGAGIVIWPPTLPQPDGYVPVTGDWALVRTIEPPTGGFLDYLNWFSDRNGVVTRNEAVAVYTGSRE